MQIMCNLRGSETVTVTSFPKHYCSEEHSTLPSGRDSSVARGEPFPKWHFNHVKRYSRRHECRKCVMLRVIFPWYRDRNGYRTCPAIYLRLLRAGHSARVPRG